MFLQKHLGNKKEGKCFYRNILSTDKNKNEPKKAHNTNSSLFFYPTMFLQKQSGPKKVNMFLQKHYQKPQNNKIAQKTKISFCFTAG